MTANISLEIGADYPQRNLQFAVPLTRPESASVAAQLPGNVLFRFRFASAAEAFVRNDSVTTLLMPCDAAVIEETWFTHSAVKAGSQGGLCFSACDDYQFSFINIDPTSRHTIRAQTRAAYEKLLAAASQRGYPHLLRGWNFFPQINEGEGDNECYRQFTVGRAEAFSSAGQSHATFPAGTAIGTRNDSTLQIVMLSGRVPAKMLENPRQTNAYNYPRQYGPAAPSFARASLIESAGYKQLLISGTASIVGSESRHHQDVVHQLEETLINIQTLANHCGWKKHPAAANAAPLFRVYLRAAADCVAIHARIRQEFGQDARIFFLYGDVCRRELLLEIESVFWIA
jgi:chorismate lyase/3-hydroxybenzoate synthase